MMDENGITWDTPAAAGVQWDAPAPPRKKKDEHGLLQNIIGGIAEPIASMASGVVAYPVSRAAGLLAAMKGSVSAPGSPEGAPDFPLQQQAAVQDALTYQPKTAAGASPANPLNLIPYMIGQGINAVGNWTEKSVAPPGSGPVREAVGHGVGEATRLLPAFIGLEGPTAAAATGAAVRGEGLGAAGFMRRALTPDKAARETGRDVRAIDTALNDTGASGPAGYNVTRGARDALNERIDNRMGELDQSVAASGARASLDPVQQRLMDEYAQAADDWSLHGEARRAAIEAQWNEILRQSGGAHDIPLQEALNVKRGFNRYTQDRYGEQFSPQDVANARAAQSGLAESTSAASPTVAAVNREVAPLINLRNMIEDRVGVTGNRPIVGFGAIAHSIPGVMTWLAERMPLANSLIARGLNTAGKGIEASGAAGLPLGMVMSQQATEAKRRKLLAELLGSQ